MVSDKIEGKMFPPSVLMACMLRAVTHSASMADTTYRIIFPAGYFSSSLSTLLLFYANFDKNLLKNNTLCENLAALTLGVPWNGDFVSTWQSD